MVTHQLALAAGYRLEHFQIERVLGKGGFGITYLAIDTRLGKRVAIKELLPDSIATRVEGVTVVPQSSSLRENWDWACERFREEARILAGFSHPAIVEVHRLIEANGTVYMVMDFIDGESYEARLHRIGKEPDQASLMAVMGPILDGLQEVHAKNLLHRDIKPENILISSRGQPVLIDFGSARSSLGATMTMTSIVTHGYSPIEQYQTKGRMGPWTDIYAAGAVMCRAITGEKPPVAADRLVEDDFLWLSYRKFAGYEGAFLNAVDWALRIRFEDRPQSIAAFAQHIRLKTTAGIPPPLPRTPTKSIESIPNIINPNSEKGFSIKSSTASKITRLLAPIIFLTVAFLLIVLFFKTTFKTPSDKKIETPAAILSEDTEKNYPEAPIRESQQQAAAEAAPVDEALANRVKVLVSDSDKAFRIADFDLGISKIQEAGKLVPGDPGILLRLARLQEKMGKPAEALATYREVLALPNLPAELRAQTERKIATIRIPEAQTGPVVEAAAEGADARDEFGLQPGASLGILDTRLAAGPGAAKTLRISIKSRPDLRVDPRQMAVHVFFYDRDASGNVQLTESQIQTEWASPPVNWSEKEPELLNAIYNPPAGAGGSGTPAYAGYVVGIYYNGELQDTRADPSSLARVHPLPLYLKGR